MHSFVVSRERARDAIRFLLGRSDYPCARAGSQNPRLSGPAAAGHCGRLVVTLILSPARRLSASPPGVSIRAPAWPPRASDTFVPATVRSERSFTDQPDSSSKCHNFLSMSLQAIAGPVGLPAGVTPVSPGYCEQDKRFSGRVGRPL